MKTTAFFLFAALSALAVGCKHEPDGASSGSIAPIPTVNSAETEANKVGDRIADLLSVKCKDGWHIATTGDLSRAFPERLVKMTSKGPIRDRRKFLGYQWEGDFGLGPKGPNGGFYGGGGYNVFERGDHWYLLPGDGEAAVPVEDLRSGVQACPKD